MCYVHVPAPGKKGKHHELRICTNKTQLCMGEKKGKDKKLKYYNRIT